LHRRFSALLNMAWPEYGLASLVARNHCRRGPSSSFAQGAQYLRMLNQPPVLNLPLGWAILEPPIADARIPAPQALEIGHQNQHRGSMAARCIKAHGGVALLGQDRPNASVLLPGLAVQMNHYQSLFLILVGSRL